VVLKLNIFGEYKRVPKSVSKVENIEEFWDFDYETTFETKQKKG
jgi:hypothetical protein